MARADSTISVNIIGDARKLNKALGKAAGGVDNFGQKVVGGLVALAVVDKATDVVGSMLDSADRAGDAMGRMVSLLGQADTRKLQDMADGFSDIGVSAPDFLEITAGFAEFATASGKLEPAKITEMAPGVAEFAGALGRLKDVDPSTLGDDIANFISGTRGAAAAAKELGVPFDAALTPAQRYAQLMERLPGLLEQVTGANQGLDDKQSELNAKWETFGSEVGPVVEDVLSAILDFTLDEIAALPAAIQGFGLLGDAAVQLGRDALGPLGRLKDVLEDIIGLFDQTNAASPGPGLRGRQPGAGSERSTTNDLRNWRERNGLGGQQGNP